MRDLLGNKPLNSFADFNRLFSLPNSIRGSKVRVAAMESAYKALIALERGRREDYLHHRRHLAAQKWELKFQIYLSFHRSDAGWPMNWYDVVLSTVSERGAALAYEAEESCWETIYPGCTRLQRMSMTERVWEQAKFSPSAWYSKPVINMMNFRIGQVIRTGSRKQPLISLILDSQPELRSRFENEFAQYECELLKAGQRRRRRQKELVEAVRNEVDSEGLPPMSSGGDFLVVRPVVPARL